LNALSPAELGEYSCGIFQLNTNFPYMKPSLIQPKPHQTAVSCSAYSGLKLIPFKFSPFLVTNSLYFFLSKNYNPVIVAG